jgi:hypothetical protein
MWEMKEDVVRLVRRGQKVIKATRALTVFQVYRASRAKLGLLESVDHPDMVLTVSVSNKFRKMS